MCKIIYWQDIVDAQQHLSMSSEDISDTNNRTLTSEDFQQLMPALSVIVQGQSDSNEVLDTCDDSNFAGQEDSTNSPEKISHTAINFTESNSFVKTMLAEAMAESLKEIHSSRSSSSTEKTASGMYIHTELRGTLNRP